ncbi:MAG: isoamylase N-terminal protein [Frankiales bacterium]|nr:isoamylase N-terminal protein [Frankiales bacterium]
MAISITTDEQSRSTRIRFVLPDDVHDGPVSAVGSFNDWTPGKHKLVRRTNGTRSVTLTVPAGDEIQEIKFRYLGSGGVWFDDPDAHDVLPDGGVLHL